MPNIIFTMNPLSEQPDRLGYLTDFNVLLGEEQVSLAKDLNVFFPADIKPTYAPLGELYQMGPGIYQINVIANLELFERSGIPGNSLSFRGLISSPNANLLRMLQPPMAQYHKVTFGWWSARYDSGTQKWVEGMYPKNPERMSGQLRALSVGNEPIERPPGRGLYQTQYRVSFEIVTQ